MPLVRTKSTVEVTTSPLAADTGSDQRTLPNLDRLRDGGLKALGLRDVALDELRTDLVGDFLRLGIEAIKSIP